MAKQITEQTLSAKIQAYQTKLAQDPHNLEAILEMGILFGQMQQWDTAIVWFKQAITLNTNNINSYILLARAYLKQSKQDKAFECYQQALKLRPDIFAIHYDLALFYQQQNNYSCALKHYAKALELRPDSHIAHFSLGLAFLKQGNYQQAIIQFSNVIHLYPNYVPGWINLGHSHFLLNQLAQAQECYQKALTLHPKQIEALNNLGAISLREKQYVIAMQFFAKILQIDEDHLEARSNLAASLLHQDRYLEAIHHYREFLRRNEDDSDAHYNLGVALMSVGELEQAKNHFFTAIKSNTYAAAAHVNLGAIYLKEHATDLAIQHYRAAQQLQPDNPSVNYLLGALNQNSLPQAAPATYVRDLFDNYAGSYDSHMLQTLHYQVPGLLKKTLSYLLGNRIPFWHILDLGCGTGLAGSVFRDWAQVLIGIDLSPKMLAIANKKGIYTQLLESDFLTGLQQYSQNIDLIIAADAWIYQGDLSPLYAACRQSLKPKGWLAFSTEITQLETYELKSSGRYAHNVGYLKALAQQQGYLWLHHSQAIARQQEHEPVWVNLIVLRKI